MKKALQILSLSIIIIVFIPYVKTNAQIFDRSDIVANIGVGLGNAYKWHYYSAPSLPVFYISGDYCLREDLGPGNLGVGAILAYSAYKYVDDRYGALMIGARGTYHFVDLVYNLDVYGGITLGAK